MSKLSFYLQQAKFNVKKALLIIIGLSIALSLVSGMFYFSDSSESKLINDNLSNFSDINVQISSNSEFINEDYIEKSNLITNRFKDSNLKILEIFNFSYYDPYAMERRLNIITRDNDTLEKLPDYKIINGEYKIRTDIFMSDSKFYTSNSFHNDFHILKGHVPNNEGEIMIDYGLALLFNLSIGIAPELNFTINNLNVDFNFTLQDLNISGIYIANNYHSLKLFSNDFYNPYFQYTINNMGNYITENVIFCYKDYSNLENNHPIQLLMRNISDSLNYNGKIPHGYNGLLIKLNRNSISLNSLTYLTKSINYIVDDINELYGNDITIYNIIGEYLNDPYLQSSVKSFKFAMQLINLPCLLFGIYFGNFAFKTYNSSRNEEFLLLKSKGIPKSMLRNQILFESIFAGIIASIISIFLGFLLFPYINDNFSKFINQGELVELRVNPQSFIIIIGVGIALSILSVISSIKKLNKLETSELLVDIGGEDLNIVYDEVNLYEAPESENSTIKERFNHKEKFSKNIDLKKDIKDHVKTSEKKIRKLGVPFIILSLFPIIFILIQYLSQLPTATDDLIIIAQRLQGLYTFLSIIVIISPVLFTTGLISVLTKESPKRYGKISKFIGKLFLKDKSYLLGLEMVKRKGIITVTRLIAIFISMLMFSNILINSLMMNSIIRNNIYCGADIKIDSKESDYTDLTQVEQMKTDLLNVKNNNNQKLIDNVEPIFRIKSEITSYGNEYYYFSNISNYLKIINDPQKNFYIPKLYENLDYTISTIKNSTDPCMIVSKSVLEKNNLTIGDTYKFNIYMVLYENDVFVNKLVDTYMFKIVMAMNYLPGIYIDEYRSQYYNPEYFLIDTSILEINMSYTVMESVLIDVNPDIEDNSTIIIESILNETSIRIERYDEYIFKANENGEYQGINETYNILNIIFTILSIQLSVGLAILMISIQNKNKQFNGLLLSRGFGKRNLFMFLLSQLLVISVLSISSGTIGGYLSGSIFISYTNSLGGSIMGLQYYPIFVNLWPFGQSILTILVSSYALFLIITLFQMKKPISHFMHKF